MSQKYSYKDPFNAGQMIGMLTMVTFLEKNPEIPEDILDQLKTSIADNAQEYLEKPTEDIFLMIDDIVSEIKTWKQ